MASSAAQQVVTMPVAARQEPLRAIAAVPHPAPTTTAPLRGEQRRTDLRRPNDLEVPAIERRR
jgi:hypothetical protein